MKRKPMWTLVFLCALAAFGCATQAPERDICGMNEDCTAGKRCLQGRCQHTGLLPPLPTESVTDTLTQQPGDATGYPRNSLRLSRIPRLTEIGRMEVSIAFEDGRPALPLSPARPFADFRRCYRDGDCGPAHICGQDRLCYGDGWVHFHPTPGETHHRIRLSGLARTEFSPGASSKILRVTYTPNE